MLSNKIKREFIKFLSPIYKIYSFYKLCYFKKCNPKDIAEKRYFKTFGRHIDWNHPTEFNEKIRWMQFNSDTSKWTLLADKYKVRDYVKSKGYDDILIPLLGMWEKADNIDFDKLPNSFVIKTNHGCGEVITVRNKSNENLKIIRSKMNHFINTPFGYRTAEPHYLKIHPVIIAEEMLENDCKWSSSLVDYKFYCFYGEPYCCAVFFNRDIVNHKRCAEIYDMEWCRHDEWINDNHKPEVPIDIPCPKSFNQMILACQDLAAEFPFVRMDFYESNGHLYFGEFTFTPAAMTGGSLSRLLLDKLGERLVITDIMKKMC